jgi:small subunit ribosomal protein S20
MPVTKSARKKLKQDRKRENTNNKIESSLKKVVKDTRKNVSVKKLQEAFSAIDKAAKDNIIHKNKAARMKASLSKLLAAPVKTTEKIAKATKIKTKKTPVKKNKK